jgi:hypothetical protein
MASHLDGIHLNSGKRLKCRGCGDVLGREELRNPALHFKKNKKCEEGDKLFFVLKKVRPMFVSL